jgi:hypothetical protein
VSGEYVIIRKESVLVEYLDGQSVVCRSAYTVSVD